MAELTITELLSQQVVAVEPMDAMAEAGRKILLIDFVTMLENEVGSRMDDGIEAVHDMRVATRRMRSVLHLLGGYYKGKRTRTYQQHLNQLADVLGAVRDLDVMFAPLVQYHATLEDEADQANLQVVIDKLGKKRAKARAKLNAYLDSKSYRKFVEGFVTFVTQAGKGAKAIADETAPFQVRHVLPIILNEQVASVRAYDNVLGDASPETLHALRIAFKRLRYTVDCFSDVLGPTAEAYNEKIKVLQDHLGALNDLTVAQSTLRGLIDDGVVKKAQKGVIKGYVKVLKAQQSELLEGLPSAWEHFNTRTVQSKLMNAILALR